MCSPTLTLVICNVKIKNLTMQKKKHISLFSDFELLVLIDKLHGYEWHKQYRINRMD